MALSPTLWDMGVSAGKAALAKGKLCPAMRRLPSHIGNLGAEVLVAGVEIVRKILDVVLVLPALVQMWDRQESCPLVTRGHTLMLKCGSDLFSLDDFFDALNRANAHFWLSFSIVAE